MAVAGVLNATERATVNAACGPCERVARFEAVFRTQVDFVARSVRRLGIPEADIEDAVQQVFMIMHDKLEEVRAGSERSYLFGTAMRVVANSRRVATRRQERFVPSTERELEPFAAEPLRPDEALDQIRARRLLDELLDTLPTDQRAVLVLFELEGCAMVEIGQLMGVPLGTVASRLRLARQRFKQEIDMRRSELETQRGDHDRG